MRMFGLAMVLFSLTGCPDDKGTASGTTESTHPLLFAQCQAGTQTACGELETKCKEGDDGACSARKKIGKSKSMPMRGPAPMGSEKGSERGSGMMGNGAP